MTPITIAVDAMGGDQGLDLVIPAVLESVKKNPTVHYILVGDEAGMRSRLPANLDDYSTIELVHAEEVVEMDEPPAMALRKKRKSSMRLAIKQVKEGRASACVSAGNTGALMAIARFVLKMLPGLDRPAIISGFPSSTDHITYMLDLGANVDSTAENLYQFAVMGSVLASAVSGKSAPRVALLNVGEEEIKGNEVIKNAAALLGNETALNYVGFIEGDRLFRDEVDVIVCDGFVGNVALKTAEGVAHYIKNQMKSVLMADWKTKLMALLCRPLFIRTRHKLDPDKHNGACFLGLNGVVIKSHGGTSVRGFTYALEEAIKQAKAGVPDLLKGKVAQILNREQ
jgi:phosphate acyltransferase